MPKLPTSANVPSASVTRDPGLNVPSPSAFQSTGGIFASEFAPAVEDTGDALRRVQEREDTRQKALRAEAKAVQDELFRANERIRKRQEALASLRAQGRVRAQLRQHREALRAEGDLSDPKVLQEHGKSARAITDQELSQYTGSEEGRFRLAEMLEREFMESSDKAAVLSVKAADDRVEATSQEIINSLSARALQGEPIADLVDEGLGHIQPGSPLADAMRPGQERVFSEAALKGIYGNAVEFYIQQGDFRTAENLLRDPDVQRAIGGDPGTARRINQMKKDLDDLTQTERRAQRLGERLGDMDLGSDIAFGNVVLSTPNKFGEQTIVNLVTRETLPVTPVQAQAITEAVQEDGDPTGVLQDQQTVGAGQVSTEQGAPVEGTMIPLEEFVQSAVGPGGNTAAFVSNVLGPFVPGAIMEDRTEARAAVRFFSQVTKKAFINNPKAPVAEQQLVAKFLPDVDAFFQDPDKARSDVRQLRKGLASLKNSYQKEINEKRLTSKREAELSDSISRIDVTLEMMGPDLPLVNNQEELDSMKEAGKIKPGDEFYWTDGKRYTVE